MVWNDERMDDLAGRMDGGFADLRADIKDVRGEMNDLRSEMHTGLETLRADLHSEMHYGLAKLHAEVSELRSMMFRFGITMFAAMSSLIAALAVAILAAILTG